MDMHTVGHSVGFFDVATVKMFSSVNKMILTSLGEYFSATLLTAAWEFASVSFLHGDF